MIANELKTDKWYDSLNSLQYTFYKWKNEMKGEQGK